MKRSHRPVERRERRQAGEIFLHTRPHDGPKKGQTQPGETQLNLVANFFELTKAPEWNLYMYSVSYEPNIESIGMRRAMLRQHVSTLGGYLFSGTTVFLSNFVGEVQCLNSRSREDVDYHVKLKFTKTVDLQSQEALTILNLIQRSAIRNLNMVLVGRNYFDKGAEVFIIWCRFFFAAI